MIIGFTCPPSIHFKFITKCDNFITKCDDYYKVRQNTVNIRDLNGNSGKGFRKIEGR